MRRPEQLVGLVLVAACLPSMVGCAGTSKTPRPAGASADAPLAVVASTNVYGDIARQIGGDRVVVTSLISNPDQDPHSYESNAQSQLAVVKAALVIENGGGYDDFLTRMVTSSSTRAAVINVVAVSGKKTPAGGSLNEHVWYDFPTVAKAAGVIAAALGRADPAAAAQFEQRRADFADKMRALIDREATIKKAHAGQAVAVTEPVPGWMLEALGLVDRTPHAFSAAIEEGTEVSPRVLADTLALFKRHQVAALVYNEQTSGPTTEQVKKAAHDTGTAVVPVTETLPIGKDYLEWMSDNLDAMSQALSG